MKTNELGIFPRICLICNKIRKKKKNVEQPLVNAQTKDTENSVKKYATWLNDEDMLRKISGVDFVAKEIVYHAVCRKDYQATAEATPMGKVGKNSMKNTDDHGECHAEWDLHRKVYAQAYEIVKDSIQENICILREVHYLNDINHLYHAAIKEIGGESFAEIVPSAQKLQTKLLKTFGDSICITKSTS